MNLAIKLCCFIKVTKLSTKWILRRTGLDKPVLFKDIRKQAVVYVVAYLPTWGTFKRGENKIYA